MQIFKVLKANFTLRGHSSRVFSFQFNDQKLRQTGLSDNLLFATFCLLSLAAVSSVLCSSHWALHSYLTSSTRTNYSYNQTFKFRSRIDLRIIKPTQAIFENDEFRYSTREGQNGSGSRAFGQNQ